MENICIDLVSDPVFMIESFLSLGLAITSIKQSLLLPESRSIASYSRFSPTASAFAAASAASFVIQLLLYCGSFYNAAASAAALVATFVAASVAASTMGLLVRLDQPGWF